MRSSLVLRRLAGATLFSCLMSAASAVLAADGSTVRIEPRPVYGATVTIEEGVRVYRPLPPERYVVVNPGGATPLNLSIEEKRVIQRSTSTSRSTHVYRDFPGRYYRSFIPAVGDY